MCDTTNENVTPVLIQTLHTPLHAVIDARPPFYVVQKKNGRLSKTRGKVDFETSVKAAKLKADIERGEVRRVVGIIVEVNE